MDASTSSADLCSGGPTFDPTSTDGRISNFPLHHQKNEMGWHSHQVQTEREEATVFRTGCLGRLGLELIEQLRLYGYSSMVNCSIFATFFYAVVLDAKSEVPR